MQSSTGALRYNEQKPEWALVDFDALLPMVHVLMYGKDKYSANNWKKGLPYTKTIESLLRHTFAFLEGEDVDKESGLPHVGHMMCNVLFLSYYWKNIPEMDDRYGKNKESE